jgi:phospholipid/cholesterol/gamma-HCH transport system substrate-binding protein
MLTRFVRIQLVIFTIASVVGISAMTLYYLQLPTLLGMGKITVTLQLPATGGLYRFSNVTYRGVQIGKVTAVKVTASGARATLTLDSSPKIPADVQADVRSVSAVGEQYVDLQPRTDSGPYLRDGSVISQRDTTIPTAVGPMLDQVSALVESIPKEKFTMLLDESFKGLNGAGFDLGSLADSSAKFAGGLNGAADRARGLVDDSSPLLDGQAQTADATRIWARSLAGVTQQFADHDADMRTILTSGAPALNEISQLLTQLKPTLPVLLANLTTIGQIAVTYNPSLEQFLVLLPPAIAETQASGPTNNPTGQLIGDFAIALNDPPPCTVGFLPPSKWRSPTDTTDTDTPDGLYCKLPQDSPISVRGARNYPCMGHPGKRAPTVAICDSDQPYTPLAMRQHVFGPYPIDPNLLRQGVPPDDRVTFNDHIFAPVEGTPPPPGAPAAPGPQAGLGSLPGPATAPGAAPGPPGDPPAPGATDAPAAGAPPAVAPSGLTSGPGHGRPLAAAAVYNPSTGMYVTADGHLFRQTDLASTSKPKTWQDLLPK